MATASLPAPSDGVIRQRLSHRARETSHKMRAIIPRHVPLIFPPQEGFVDERGALEGVVRSFSAEVDFREAKQLVVVGPNHFVERFGSIRRHCNRSLR